jgi:nicotinamidase-related amidase
MTRHVWEDLLTDRDSQVITAAGYDEGSAAWESRGEGTDPLVLVVDMQRAIVGEDMPILEAIESSDYGGTMGRVAWEALNQIEPFLDCARDFDVPVTYTKVVPAGYDSPDHPDLQIADRIAPEPDDDVVTKSYASAFYGTDLLTRLVRDGIDTVVVVGNSTSGCVRGTVVDAQSRGFNVIVPQECVFDRIETSHKVALLDMWMKYAEVLEREEAMAYLERTVDEEAQ